MVTVGFSWTLAKGFLKREEKRGFSMGDAPCRLGCPRVLGRADGSASARSWAATQPAGTGSAGQGAVRRARAPWAGRVGIWAAPLGWELVLPLELEAVLGGPVPSFGEPPRCPRAVGAQL